MLPLRIFTTFSIIPSAAIFCLDACILRRHGMACSIHDAPQVHHTENPGKTPMPFIRPARRAACALAALVAASPAMAASNGKPEPKWKFQIDPALRRGVFSINARTSEPETVFVAIRDISTSPARMLAESRHDNASEIRIGPGKRSPHDLFLEVRMTTSTEAAAPKPDSDPVFAWRTLVPREGTSLMDYQGLPDLAPPPDFDAYWARARAQLAAVPMNPAVTPVPKRTPPPGCSFAPTCQPSRTRPFPAGTMCRGRRSTRRGRS